MTRRWVPADQRRGTRGGVVPESVGCQRWHVQPLAGFGQHQFVGIGLPPGVGLVEAEPDDQARVRHSGERQRGAFIEGGELAGIGNLESRLGHNFASLTPEARGPTHARNAGEDVAEALRRKMRQMFFEPRFFPEDRTIAGHGQRLAVHDQNRPALGRRNLDLSCSSWRAGNDNNRGNDQPGFGGEIIHDLAHRHPFRFI